MLADVVVSGVISYLRVVERGYYDFPDEPGHLMLRVRVPLLAGHLKPRSVFARQ